MHTPILTCTDCGERMYLNDKHACLPRTQHTGSSMVTYKIPTLTTTIAPTTVCGVCLTSPCLCQTGFKYNTAGCPDCQGDVMGRECICKTGFDPCPDCGSPQWPQYPGYPCLCKMYEHAGPPVSADFLDAFRKAIKARRAIWHDVYRTHYMWCSCPSCVSFREVATAVPAVPVEPPAKTVERELSCPTCRRIFCTVKVSEDIGPIHVICEGCLREGR